jgi:hypothetical protein
VLINFHGNMLSITPVTSYGQMYRRTWQRYKRTRKLGKERGRNEYITKEKVQEN